MWRTRLALMCSCCLAAAASAAHAGNNAGASVGLRWDEAALRSSPAGFPLYLEVHDARDLRQLAIRLSWVSDEAGGNCFRVSPAGRAVDCSGFAAPSAGPTLADSAYVWTMVFSSTPVSPLCLVYWVTGTSCSPGAYPQFVVADVRALDSGGATDVLASRGSVILNRSAGSRGEALSRAAPRAADEADEALPTRLALFVSPNPMVGAAVIRFELPGPIAWHLAVYDITGALVLEARPEVRAQRGTFRWDLNGADGRRARPGVYFARLTTPAGTRVVPVTVLR